jgi:tripartite-type tricarboxylate transporter receptor subunit TctC
LSSASLTFPASALSDYDFRHFQMIAVAQATNPVICVRVDSPFTTMEEWMDAIRAGDTTASNSGLGGIWHLPQLVIVNAIGGSATYIAYDGGRPAVFAAAQGEIDWSMSDLGEAMTLIQEGLVRPLAVHSVNDIYLEGYGNIPSILNWLPEVEGYIPLTNGFRGFAIRRGTPQNIIDTWIEALRVVLNSSDVIEAAKGMNITPLAIFGEEAEAMAEGATYYGSWLLYDMGYAERSPADVGLVRR